MPSMGWTWLRSGSVIMDKHWEIFNYDDIHTHKPSEGSVMSVEYDPKRMSLPAQAFTLGVHPWNAREDIDWEEFENLLSNPLTVGIGEAGLDKLKGPEMNIQEEVFLRQLQLAEKHQLPVIIHSVRSNHRILELKKKLNPTVPWIIHGFRGNVIEAKQLVSHGIHLSLGKHHDKEIAKTIPAEYIHYETDEIDNKT